MREIGDRLMIRADGGCSKMVPRGMFAHSEGRLAADGPLAFAWLPNLNEQ